MTTSIIEQITQARKELGDRLEALDPNTEDEARDVDQLNQTYDQLGVLLDEENLRRIRSSPETDAAIAQLQAVNQELADAGRTIENVKTVLKVTGKVLEVASKIV